MRIRLLVGFVVATGIRALVGCADQAPVGPGQPPDSPGPGTVPSPRIVGIDPASVEPGQNVSIIGSNFGPPSRALTVTFNATQGVVHSRSDSVISAQVPISLNPGTVAVVVSVVGADQTATIDLDVHLGAPIINAFDFVPRPGERVTMIGRNFGFQQERVTVTVDALPVEFTLIDNTRITLVVPTTAEPGTARVQVTVGEQSSPRATLRIAPLFSPTISAVGPSVARPGIDVVVFGSHFGSNPSLVSVEFCRQVSVYGYYYGYSYGTEDECFRASFSGLADNQLTVHVPQDLPSDRWQLTIKVGDARESASAFIQVL